MNRHAPGGQEPFREKVPGPPKASIHVLFWPGWWYPNRTDPLGGIFIKKHAEAVSRYCDVSVLYITPDPGLKEKKYDLNYSLENNLRTLRFYYRPCSHLPLISKISEFINYVIAGSRGLRFLKETTGSPDMIHVNVNPPAGLIFLLFTRLRKIPFIFTEHWSGYLPANGSYKGWLRKWLTRWLVKRAGAVTTVSENLKNAMLAHKLEGRYHVVPNVVDTDLFQLPTGKDDRPGKKRRILHVSGLVPVKNIPGILRVMKRLAGKRDDFEFYIVGDGEAKEELEKSASELGILNEVVFFQGGKSVEEVAACMRESDFLLLFSDYENSPCVIVEAMASGLPVLATGVGGIPELVNERTGVLVEPRDEEGLLMALESMLDNYSRYDKDYLRAEAVKRFSYEAVGKEFFNMYNDQKFLEVQKPFFKKVSGRQRQKQG